LFQLIWLLPRISSTRSLSLVGLEYGCQASALNMMPCPNLLELDLRQGLETSVADPDPDPYGYALI
jgi:hypothetical protein